MTLQELNNLGETNLRVALANCCGASVWVNKMMDIFPVKDRTELFIGAENIWDNCSALDYLEAFMHHPKIGDIDSLKKKFASTATWASGEQAGVNVATQEILEQLAEGNNLYEEKFGYIFIVCATGKSAGEMLQLLKERLPNDAEDEIKIAAAEQHKITLLRLEKLLS